MAVIFDSRVYIDAWREHLGLGEAWDPTFPGCGAALMLVPERHCRVPLRVLRPAGTPVNPANVVIPFSGAAVNELLAYLRERRPDWDALEFAVTLDHPAAGMWVPEMLRRHGLRLVRCRDGRRPYIKVRSSWDEYYRQRSANLRQDIVRRLNKMRRRGGMRVERATGDAALPALETFFVLHQKRWKRRGLSSAYAQESARHFMRAFLTRCGAGTGWVYSLLLGDRVIAASVEFVSGSILHYYQVAMDPDFSEMSPGKVIVYSILQDAFHNGVLEVDLGYGADAEQHAVYKTHWATGEYCMRWFLVAHSPAVAAWLRLEPHIKAIAGAARTTGRWRPQQAEGLPVEARRQ